MFLNLFTYIFFVYVWSDSVCIRERSLTKFKQGISLLCDNMSWILLYIWLSWYIYQIIFVVNVWNDSVCIQERSPTKIKQGIYPLWKQNLQVTLILLNIYVYSIMIHLYNYFFIYVWNGFVCIQERSLMQTEI